MGQISGSVVCVICLFVFLVCHTQARKFAPPWVAVWQAGGRAFSTPQAVLVLCTPPSTEGTAA